MYYAGKLLNNGKQFDSKLQGQPFKFRLGKREVIQGWDAGLKGMMFVVFNIAVWNRNMCN